MLHKTQGISLRYLRYKDSAIIAKIFTESFGLQGFVVHGIRSSKSKTSLGLFQALSLVDLVQYHDEKKELHRLQEIKQANPLQTIPFNPAKTAMALFASELISKVVKDGQPNEALFHLIRNWTLSLDKADQNFENEHIKLSWQLLSPLGIVPEHWEELFPSSLRPNDFKIEEVAPLFSSFSNENELVKMPNRLRQYSLDMILFYMSQHFEGMGQIQSLDVLRTVFR